MWVLCSQPVMLEPLQVTEPQQEGGLFYSLLFLLFYSHTVHSEIILVSSLLWMFFLCSSCKIMLTVYGI